MQPDPSTDLPLCPCCEAAPPGDGVQTRALLAMTRDLLRAGVQVNLFARDLPVNVVGRFRYPDTPDDPTPLSIAIRCASACEALKTLAHEAGHLAAFRSVEGYTRLDEATHERLAVAYGFPVIVHYAPWITREMWEDFHADEVVDAA